MEGIPLSVSIASQIDQGTLVYIYNFAFFILKPFTIKTGYEGFFNKRILCDFTVYTLLLPSIKVYTATNKISIKSASILIKLTYSNWCLPKLGRLWWDEKDSCN